MKKILTTLALTLFCVTCLAQTMEQVKRNVLREKIANELTEPTVTNFKTQDGHSNYVIYRGFITCAELFVDMERQYSFDEVMEAYASAMGHKQAYLDAEKDYKNRKPYRTEEELNAIVEKQAQKRDDYASKIAKNKGVNGVELFCIVKDYHFYVGEKDGKPAYIAVHDFDNQCNRFETVHTKTVLETFDAKELSFFKSRLKAALDRKGLNG